MGLLNSKICCPVFGPCGSILGKIFNGGHILLSCRVLGCVSRNILEGSHVSGSVSSEIFGDICGHINSSVTFDEGDLSFVQSNLCWGRSIDGGVLRRVSSGVC